MSRAKALAIVFGLPAFVGAYFAIMLVWNIQAMGWVLVGFMGLVAVGMFGWLFYLFYQMLRGRS